MERKTIPFRSLFGKDYELAIKVYQYAGNGRLAIGLSCQEDGYFEPYTMLTVNLPDEQVGPGEAFIKTCDENTGLMEFVLENRLGKVLPEAGVSGFCTYPKVAFDMERLKEFDKDGVEKYLAAVQSTDSGPSEHKKGAEN